MNRLFVGLLLVLMVMGISISGYAEKAKEPVWFNIFPEGLINADASEYNLQDLEGKVFGLYFSASWCRGCAAFSRTFVPFRDKHQENFEVVLVGFDHSSVDMMDYMNRYKMTWPAIPYDSPARIALKERFNVTSIPTLIIMSQDGRVLTEDGREQVETMEDNAIKHWLELDAQGK